MSPPALVASPLWELGPTEKDAPLQAEAGEVGGGRAGTSRASRGKTGADVQVGVTAGGHRGGARFLCAVAAGAMWDSARLLAGGACSFQMPEHVPRRVK